MTPEDLRALFAPTDEELRRLLADLPLGGRGPHDALEGEQPVDVLDGDLPEHGVGMPDALRTVAGLALAGARDLADPGFFAHMDPPTPWPTWVTSLWAASRNQNLLHPDTGGRAREVERTVVRWLVPHFGMAGGHLVPGSTLANLTALWVARDLTGATDVVASGAAHVSVAKAARVLGMTYRAVPVDRAQRLDLDRLGDCRRAVVVLTAGTTAVGAVDPMLPEMRASSDAAWVHVDAAWAGPLVLSDRYRTVLAGIDLADSIAVSAHKWLFQPKESALVAFRLAELAEAAITFDGPYLAAPNVGLLGSHGAAAGFSLAATLLGLGRQGIADVIDASMAVAERLVARIEADERLECFDTDQVGVVAWRPIGVDPREVVERLTGAFVSLTRVDGAVWLRSVAANPLADADRVVDAVVEVSVG